MESNSIFINTDIPFANIYDKTLAQLIQVHRPFFNDCNADNLLLLNGLYLTIEDMVLKMIHANKMDGGQGYERKTKQKYTSKTIQKGKKKNRKLGKGKGKGNGKTRKNKTKQLHGGNKNWISKLIFSLMAVILMIGKNVLSLQPEYDNDVVKRLVNAGEIKELFENKHGTCAINSALFLGSINLKTYADVTEQIIKRGHGLTFTEATSYLNSSLKTLWEWESIPNEELLIKTPTQRRYLRGSLSENVSIQRREKINVYVQTMKNKLIQMRNNMSMEQRKDATQGILTALSYPSDSVQHAVVVWLTSDERLVIIDPQEFMQGNVVLYMDNVDRDVGTDFLSNKFLKMGLDDYFMKYFDERESGVTLILRDMHVRKEEHLEEMVRENPMVNQVIEKIKLLENATRQIA